MRVRVLLAALIVVALALAAQIAVSHSHAHGPAPAPVGAQPSVDLITAAAASATDAPLDEGPPETEGLCSAVALTGLVLLLIVQPLVTHPPRLLPHAPVASAPLAIAAMEQQRTAPTPLASMAVCRQ